MNQDYIPYLFFGFVFALTAALIVWSVRYAKKRTAEIAAIAQQIGFTFLGKDWRGPILSSQHKTCLLQRTRGKFRNVMTGTSGGCEVSLFDYTYHVGKSTVTLTMACFSHDLPLPAFELRPENVFDRMGDALVHRDIDFDSHPDFSKRYLLRSPDEVNTRKLFTPSLLAYMEQISPDKRWHIESTSTVLIVYRDGRPVMPSGIPPFLDETSSIARTIFSSAGPKISTT